MPPVDSNLLCEYALIENDRCSEWHWEPATKPCTFCVMKKKKAMLETSNYRLSLAHPQQTNETVTNIHKMTHPQVC